MFLFLVITGILFIIGSIVAFFMKKSSEKQLLTLGAMESSSIAELEKLSDEVGKDEALGGKGYFNRDVKINGTIGCDNPLRSEFAKTNCVWYESKVIRVYEVENTRRDNNGNITTNWERKEETVSNKSNKTDFWITDETGKIYVSFNDLNFDKEKSYDMYKPANEIKGSEIRIGEIVLNIGNMDSRGSRTLGYKYIEEVLPVGKKVIVAGEARDVDGVLRFYKPQEKHFSYMLRFGTETELMNSLKKAINTESIIFAASGVGGLIALGLGIILRVLNII